MKILSLFTIIILLSSCASQSPYRQATGNGYGFQEVQLSDTQYSIRFKLRGDNVAKAKDFALLRAAELTLEHGYSWFQVVDKESAVEKHEDSNFQAGVSRQTETITNCGLLTCQSTTRPTTGYHASAEIGGRSDKTERMIEIRMGKGVQPQDGRSYNAKQIKSNLTRRYQVAN